ncbi:T9SS type A sorting domain-containing protein [Flavobacteriaceae bacterium W22]|nr:T9SS type A sorting domain-containing protein [Flavobacteriaceae bacterium W22]
MKTIYSFALAILAYCGASAQTNVYTQDFTTFTPQNWYMGYSYDPTVGTGPQQEDMYNAYLVQRSFLNNQTNNNPSVSVEMYSAGLSCWAISPSFDLSAGGHSVSFDYGAASGIYSNDPTAQAPQGQTDDVFKFLISTDNGTTWQELESVNSPNIGIPNARTTKTYALSNFNSATTKFAFYTSNGSVPDWGTDYVLYFDDFKIQTGVNLSTNEGAVKNKNVAIYPNPTHGAVYVKSDKEVKSIEIYDFTGKLVSKGTKIDLTSSVSGNYLVKVIFKDNSFVTEKIIKK